MMDERILKLAKRIEEEGGRAFLVGGCVRDEIMGLTQKDFDVEVYKLAPEKLREVISEFGKVDAVGASFQVYKVGQDIDVSLPRRERKQGTGHKGFVVEGDPDMTFTEACSRRDFTINAVMKDVLTGELVDPFKGQEDIKEGVLRVVSLQSFAEDSLRVLRLVQFVARFGFSMDADTYLLARSADLSDLPKERIWMELEKLFLKGKHLEEGLMVMENLGVVKKLFPKLHLSFEVVRAMKKAQSFVNDLNREEKLVVLLSVLLSETKDFQEVLHQMGAWEAKVSFGVEEVLKNLQHANLAFDYDFYRLAEKVKTKLMSRVLYALGSEFAESFADTIERLGIEEKAPEPILKGRDLIEAGFEPSKKFGEILSRVYDMQLRGMIRDHEHAKAVGKNLLHYESVY